MKRSKLRGMSRLTNSRLLGAGFIVAIVVAGLLTFAAGCSSHGRAERAGRKVDRAVDKADQKADQVGDKIEHSAERTGDKIERAADELDD